MKKSFKNYCLQQEKERKEFKKYLLKVAPKELTTYTDFRMLTAEQKLIWLSYYSEFVEKNHGALKKNKKKVA